VIEVITPGILSSVQDQGRHGYRQIGVGSSGAMDSFALSVANLLVENEELAAGIEVTLGGCILKFNVATTIALTGCNVNASLDGRAIPAWSALSVNAGQTLTTEMSTQGLRCYIAIAGGLNVPLVMGSRSTDLKAGFGGFSGRALAAGDRLKICATPLLHNLNEGFGLSRAMHYTFNNSKVVKVRMLPAAQWENYNTSNQQRFLNSQWQVTQQSNRLGYRLSGIKIVAQNNIELLSHGILPGCVQMPPSGQPVIQLNDANTCGGYPKLGVVIHADLSKLAQVRPGESIHFTLCSAEDARQATRSRLQLLAQIKRQATTMRQQLMSAKIEQQSTIYFN